MFQKAGGRGGGSDKATTARLVTVRCAGLVKGRFGRRAKPPPEHKTADRT